MANRATEEVSAGAVIRVELFGLLRIITGRREMDVSLPANAGHTELMVALAEACPVLVGRAIRPDLSALEDGYVFNLNGVAFLGDGDLDLKPGDTLLLLSNQAGG